MPKYTTSNYWKQSKAVQTKEVNKFGETCNSATDKKILDN